MNLQKHSLKLKSLAFICLAAFLCACADSGLTNENEIPASPSNQASAPISEAASGTSTEISTSVESVSPNSSSAEQRDAGKPDLQSPSSPERSAENAPSDVPSGAQPESTNMPSPLHVEGTCLVDENGAHVQLYGMSTHGLSWFPQYVSRDTFETLRTDWKANCVRLAMYTAEYGGYCTGGDKENLKELIRNGVDYATELGMYVIVDWHILSEQDPNVYKEDAKEFFSQMSAEFADHANVLYEICNEPNGYATWESVKSYAEEVIPCIRENDPDAVILVGTPTWSQDIDKALANPLEFDNIMYTLHFYAATHKDDLRNRLENCVSNGLPVFVSEFGMCDASGNGGNDFDSAQAWIDLLNQHDVSFICWNLANKGETSSVIRSDVSSLSGWSEDELSESGKWIRNVFQNMQ